MKIKTTRFGEIEVEDEKIVHFKDGIPAFDDEHEFIVIPYGDEENGESPYYFMQSVKTPDLAFLMTVPYVFFPTYEFRLDDSVTDLLGLDSPDDIVLYTLITIPAGDIKAMTTNLLAPIVINKKNMQAKQVVLSGTSYTTKHRLFGDESAKEDK